MGVSAVMTCFQVPSNPHYHSTKTNIQLKFQSVQVVEHLSTSDFNSYGTRIELEGNNETMGKIKTNLKKQYKT